MGILAVIRHELRQYFYTPLTYILQIAFLLTLSVCIFLVADFYATDDASPRLLVTFLPWIALISVPALCSRVWVDEPGDRSLELSFTLSIPTWVWVVGRFFTAWFVMLITLLFTIPFVITLYWLGAPDTGVLVGAYLGAALLLAAYVALTLCIGAFVREQVGTFVLGVGSLFLLLVLGWDVFGRLIKGLGMPWLSETLVAMSPQTWLNSISTGVVSLNVAIGFLATIGVALFTCVWALNRRRAGELKLVPRLVAAVAVGGTIVLIALWISLPSRTWMLDLTAGKQYTLNPGSQQILRKVPNDVHVTLYWSETQPDIPVAIRVHAQRVESLFRLAASRAAGHVSVKLVDPIPDSDAELDALAHGIGRIPMSSGDYFYLGAIVRHGDRVGRIPYFDNRRERLLEYDIMVVFNGLTRTATPKVGVLSPLVAPSAVQSDHEGLSFLLELRQTYDVAVVPYFKTELPDDLDVLVVVDAGLLRSSMLYEIDQFVMRGGSLVVLIDPYVRLNKASNQITLEPSEAINDISDLLLAYGVRYESGLVVGDVTLGAPVSSDSNGTMTYPYWLRIPAERLSSSHPVTASLNELLLVEPGELSLLNERARALVLTSSQSGGLNRSNIEGQTPQQLASKFVADQRERIIAAVIDGPYSSAYPQPPLEPVGVNHLAHSAIHGTVFVVADVDWIYDPFALQTVELDGQSIVRPLNDNYAFLMNMVEYATGDPALLAIRSRGQIHRRFTLVAERFKRAEQQYRAQQAKLTNEITAAEAHITDILTTAGVDKVAQLPPSLRDKVHSLQLNLLPLKRQLRDIRLQIRQSIDKIGHWITAINLIAGPVLVLGMALLVFRSRRSYAGS